MHWTPQVGDSVVLVDEDDATGRIIEDFGEIPELPADADLAAPRRWAVATDDGGLSFADTAGLEPGSPATD